MNFKILIKIKVLIRLNLLKTDAYKIFSMNLVSLYTHACFYLCSV